MNESLQPESGPENEPIIDDAVDATNRLIASMHEKKEEQGERIPVTFHIPGSVQVKLTAQEQEFSEGFDRYDSQGLYTHSQIRDKLAKDGLKPAESSDEIEEQEQERLAQVRKHAQSVHKPRTSSSKKLRNPARPGRGGDKDAPEHITHIDGERIIR